jgi:tyrosyl-tRNA synthetase
MPEYVYDPAQGKVWIVRLLSSAGLVSSNAEARRLIQQGAVSINGEKISNPDLEFVPEPDTVIKVGKRRFLRIVIPQKP